MHPVLFHFHALTIYTYGFFTAVAVFVSLLVIRRRAKRLGLDPELAGDLVFFLFVAGVMGARIFYIGQHFEEYQSVLWKIFSITEGGLVWYGGFLTAASVGLGIAVWKRWPVLRFCDLFAPTLPLAHAIGRIGCFFNGCCFGRETDLPFGVVFPGDSLARIPTQIFESAALFCLSIFLFYFPSKKRKDGELFIFYLLLYSVIRFLIEFLRGDQTTLYFLTPPQWTSILLFIGAWSLLFFVRKKTRI